MASRTRSQRATPRYLLDAYPATLAGDSQHPARPKDLQRLTELVSDIGWVDIAIARVGVDPVLSSLRTAARRRSTQRVDVALCYGCWNNRHTTCGIRSPADQLGYAATALAWRGSGARWTR